MMCRYYSTSGFPTFRAKCLLGRFASLKCHSENKCPEYKAFEEKTRQNLVAKPIDN